MYLYVIPIFICFAVTPISIPTTYQYVYVPYVIPVLFSDISASTKLPNFDLLSTDTTYRVPSFDASTYQYLYFYLALA